MSKVFGKKVRNGAGDEDLQDDMTITSGWSRGGASVSDRIMGRMKKNLSFRKTGSTRNVGSSSSLGEFKSQNSGFSIQSNGFGNTLRRRNDSCYSNAGVTSVAGVEAMEEMDSSEAMTLKGQTFGRRRNRLAAIQQRKSQRRLMKEKLNTEHDNNSREPVTYSLAELRAMSMEELTDAMDRAGVPPKDISNALNEATNLDDANEIAEEQLKNMVTLFVNSGCVKLVPLGKTREASLPTEDLEEEVCHTDTPDAEPQSELSLFEPDSVKVEAKNSDFKEEPKRSKLEKIGELKQENSQIKRENKSLKKTMKRMMRQLAVAIKERDELQSEFEKVAERGSKENTDDMPSNRTEKTNEKTSLHSHLEAIHETRPSLPASAQSSETTSKQPESSKATKEGDADLLQSTENNKAPSGELQPCHTTIENTNDSSCSVKSCPRLDNTTRQSTSSQKSESSAKSTIYMKELKNEKKAHTHTKIKMQVCSHFCVIFLLWSCL